MRIPFVRKRKIFYLISGILILFSLFSISFFGLRFGIDFKGGAVLELKFEKNLPPLVEIRQKLKEAGFKEIVVQRKGERGVLVKLKAEKENIYQIVLRELEKIGEIEKGSVSFQSIGPIVGRELKQKTKIVIILCLLAILIYIAFSFRRISRPVKSYIYGISGLVALLHDVFIPLGVFAFLGKFYGIEISIPIVTAFLTVFGYSINDSVVVFDRIRENILKKREFSFEKTVEDSLNQSLARSFNTSFTTLLVLFSIFFFGGQTLKYFSLALILGISLGTYSSLFLAGPLLVSYLNFKERKWQKEK